ncbi:hypothetical protein [Paraburkholderia sp. BCC1886]|uniref:hypothetical protein n=1 Tax=Paraburkholderia sp. BCC1886 TaxID=2562670 RepID=UPI001183F841|nr:hypothetical protein [Paraburkholderia sp. BCC1886]
MSESQHLVLASPPALRALRQWVVGPPMPTVDVDWLFQQLFGSVQVQDISYSRELYGIADHMAFGDGLWGHNDVTESERLELAQRIILAGEAVTQELHTLGAYQQDGFFPYRFKQYRNDGFLIFERTDREAA